MLAAISRSWAQQFAPPSQPMREFRMISLVALSPSWVEYSLEEMQHQLASMFLGDFTSAQSQSNWVAEGLSGKGSFAIQCMVEGYAGLYIVNSSPGPYSAFSDFLASIEDPDLKKLAAEQPCWLSVDSVRSYSTDADAYRFVALLLSAIAPDDTRVLVDPSRGLAREFTPEIRRQLAAGDSSFNLA